MAQSFRPGVHSRAMILYEIRGGRSGTKRELSPGSSGVPLLIIIPPLQYTHLPPLPKCAIALTRQHIITSSGFKFWTSSETLYLPGKRVRQSSTKCAKGKWVLWIYLELLVYIISYQAVFYITFQYVLGVRTVPMEGNRICKAFRFQLTWIHDGNFKVN
jgi:hypothetical protein